MKYSSICLIKSLPSVLIAYNIFIKVQLWSFRNKMVHSLTSTLTPDCCQRLRTVQVHLILLEEKASLCTVVAVSFLGIHHTLSLSHCTTSGTENMLWKIVRKCFKRKVYRRSRYTSPMSLSPSRFCCTNNIELIKSTFQLIKMFTLFTNVLLTND